MRKKNNMKRRKRKMEWVETKKDVWEHMDMRDRRLRHEIETINQKRNHNRRSKEMQNSYSKAISCFFANLCKL